MNQDSKNLYICDDIVQYILDFTCITCHTCKKKYNINFAQMSVKFCEIQPFMTSVIIGATTMEQLKENIESVNINLSNELIKDLNEIQKIYPNPCP